MGSIRKQRCWMLSRGMRQAFRSFSIAQAPDGSIDVHYDHGCSGQAEILFARFREVNVEAGRAVTVNADLKNLVRSRAGMRPRGGPWTSLTRKTTR